MGFLTLKIAVQIGLYVNINVNIKGPTLYSFISQECVSVVSAFVSDTENMALIWRGFLTICTYVCTIGWFKNPVSSQNEKLMAATKLSDYLGVKYYKKAKKQKNISII